jgi:hypothetical protein
MSRRRYRIDWYRGKVSAETLVEYTHVRAMDIIHARLFGKMRRPGLIVHVTPAGRAKKDSTGFVQIAGING